MPEYDLDLSDALIKERYEGREEGRREKRHTIAQRHSLEREKTRQQKERTQQAYYRTLSSWYDSVGKTLRQPVRTDGSSTTATQSVSTSQTTPWYQRRVAAAGVSAGAPTSAPTVGTGRTGVGTVSGVHFDRVTSSRLIILSMGVSGVAVIIAGQGIAATTEQVGNHTVKVPGNMRAFAGIIIFGTVALIINEFSPDLGALFALMSVLLAFADAQLFTTLGNVVTGTKAPAHPPATSGQQTPAFTSPTIPVRPGPPAGGGIWYPPSGPGGNAPKEVPYGSPSG